MWKHWKTRVMTLEPSLDLRVRYELGRNHIPKAAAGKALRGMEVGIENVLFLMHQAD